MSSGETPLLLFLTKPGMSRYWWISMLWLPPTMAQPVVPMAERHGVRDHHPPLHQGRQALIWFELGKLGVDSSMFPGNRLPW